MRSKIDSALGEIKTKKWWKSRIIVTAWFLFFFALIDFTGAVNPVLAKIVGLVQAAGALAVIRFRKTTTTAIG